MKKLVSILLVSLIVITAFASCGKIKDDGKAKPVSVTFTDGDFEYVILEDGTAKITGFHPEGNYEELNIPSSFINQSVISTTSEAESSSDEAETTALSDQIPVSVIGEEAFAGSQAIQYVNFCSTLVRIEKRAFAESSIKNAMMASSRKLTDIEEGAFADCPELIQIDIPASVVNFGAGCFANATKLVVVSFRGNQEKLDNSIFEGSNSFRVCTYKENPNIIKFAEDNNYELKVLN